MKTRVQPKLWAVWCCLALALTGWAAVPPAEPKALDDAVAGKSLAVELSTTRPTSDTLFRGTLHVRHRDRSVTRIPITTRLVLEGESWATFYEVTTTNQQETLVVRHRTGGAAEYLHGSRLLTATNEMILASLPAEKLWTPFASSDFAPGDLGMEFLRWPRQVLLRNETRKNTQCHVLESRPAGPTAYTRVVCWVDIESHGVVMAEAYGPQNQRLKEFEVNSFKKIDGQWQLQEMEMRSGPERSRTLFQFDLQEK